MNNTPEVFAVLVPVYVYSEKLDHRGCSCGSTNIHEVASVGGRDDVRINASDRKSRWNGSRMALCVDCKLMMTVV